ncbi:MAG: proline dehydrogenase family protein [Gemmatimonadales bacterium]
MNPLRDLFLRASRSRWLDNQMRRRRFAQRAVRRFMPGESVESALEACREFARQNISTVVTQLGENVATETEGRDVTEHYVGVLDAIAREGIPTHVSVKLTHLGLDLGTAFCTDQLTRLVAHASTQRNFVWVDMEGSTYVDHTLEIFRTVREANDNVGLCVQSYLYRTEHDLTELRSLRPAIRLVKGAYQEPPSIAYPRKRDVDANYMRLARRLLDDEAFREARPGLGTHDVYLLREIQRYAASKGVPKNAYEIQMLYGVRRDDQCAFAGEGCSVRVLVSYGDAWFPWYMRRLAERPANVWFLARSVVG